MKVADFEKVKSTLEKIQSINTDIDSVERGVSIRTNGGYIIKNLDGCKSMDAINAIFLNDLKRQKDALIKRLEELGVDVSTQEK